MSKLDRDLVKQAILNAKRVTPNKTKASFTFDTELFEAFRVYCDKEGIPQSRMLEELMKLVVKSESIKKP